MTAPSPAPSARVTALGATSFAVTVESVSGEAATTLRLQTRALGSAAAWLTKASDATPAVGDVLTAIGLTEGAALEARIVEENAGGEQGDGKHFIVTPASSIWATLLSTVNTVLAGQGFTSYYGTATAPNIPDKSALLRTFPEVIRRRGNNLAELDYTIEVELRLARTSDTGELRTADVATFQRAVIAALDKKDAGDYPSIPGLLQIEVDIRSKDESPHTADAFEDETRARTLIRFLIAEARV